MNDITFAQLCNGEIIQIGDTFLIKINTSSIKALNLNVAAHNIGMLEIDSGDISFFPPNGNLKDWEARLFDKERFLKRGEENVG